MPEFVHSEGLSCLIRVGAAADHNYQSYILRGQLHAFPLTFVPMPSASPTDLFPFLSLALGQLMLFVDGMLGVVAHSETVQWLYTLCVSLVSGSTQICVPFPYCPFGAPVSASTEWEGLAEAQDPLKTKWHF